ncbi:hypothetical protein LEP1GSC099_1707 [Leptospira interrogans str. UI 08452]|nr:hypothetical protein LEP1GSC099_1707 [Leptospira interrogans str. UI 08452]EMN40741.1 hypothetical protein LEP1GSC085_2805 [Leptospira interrogans str. L0996]
MRGAIMKRNYFKKLCKVFILVSFGFGNLNCSGFGMPPYKPITNTDRNYVKFNIKVSDKEEKPLSGLPNYVFIGYWDEERIFINVPFNLNPDREYWLENFKVLLYEIGWGMRDVRFYEGCDYRMPAPLGKRRYEFLFVYFHNNSPKQTVKLEKVIDLPPNHSIRLNVVPAKLPYPNPKDWTQKIENNNAPEVEIIAIVEPNPEPDEDKPCEIPKD